MTLWSNIFLLFFTVGLLGLLGCQTTKVPVTKSTVPEIIVSPSVYMGVLDRDGDGVIDRLDDCPNTPRNIVIDSRGCPPILLPKEGEVYAELRVFYDRNSSEILEKYLNNVETSANIMHKYPDAILIIEAHISEQESKLANNLTIQTLSKARAEGVKNYIMIHYNIDPKRIHIVTYGAEIPIAPNDDAESIKLNQRVYGVISNDDGFLKKYVDKTN